MLVAVAGVGILFGSVGKGAVFLLAELDGMLRAILYAGETELTVAERSYTRGCQFVVAARANFRANAATNAGIGHGKVFFGSVEI